MVYNFFVIYFLKIVLTRNKTVLFPLQQSRDVIAEHSFLSAQGF